MVVCFPGMEVAWVRFPVSAYDGVQGVGHALVAPRTIQSNGVMTKVRDSEVARPVHGVDGQPRHSVSPTKHKWWCTAFVLRKIQFDSGCWLCR